MRTFVLLSIIPLICLAILSYRKFQPMPEVVISAGNYTPLKTVPPAFRLLNEKNRHFTNFSCEMAVRIDQHKLRGFLYYEKPRNFSMEISSLLGPELLMGSNQEQFWYWSKRSRERGLFFSSHQDYDKTRLKSMFNPFWLMLSLGLDELPEAGRYFEKDKTLVVVYPEKDTLGRSITKLVFIDQEFVRFKGAMILDADSNTLAACEVLEHQYGLPKRILYDWAEENVSMLLDLHSIHVNQPGFKQDWVMPDLEPKIDIGKF